MSKERLELEQETANEALIPARDLFWPKYQPPTREKDLRKIILANPHSALGFYLRYYAAQEKAIERDTALPAERERDHPKNRFQKLFKT